ncbi:MAG TPA: FG-GAP-like repeat-containing protein [Phycisphaerae bacterium]|nr:FG-GAP-like repeat-containing protein [Phycisphaerae bacterium]
MRAAITALMVLAICAAANGQAIYHGTPDWISGDTQVSTGGALVDLDRDGWLDFVVSNGNDMAQQHVAVYYNRGDGTFPSLPDWQSADFGYNGHLAVADVNGDGWPDVAVATLGSGGTAIGPIARLYLNNNGTLSSTPNWVSPVNGNAFGVAFGDMNGDGRPDLAVATGWAYDPQAFYRNYVYLNVGGTLEQTASWVSSDTYHFQGFVWVSAYNNGLLDLAGAASRSRNRMYRNLGVILETTGSWTAADVTTPDSVMVTAGDVTGDGRRDLFIADNNQLTGGSGRFRQYNGLAGGGFSTTANWTYSDGYCSAVALADLNADGKLDLATGAWWDYTRVFFNTGTGFGSSSSWNSTGTSVVEKIAFGDIDKNGLRPISETFPASASKLYYLSHQPIQEITSVERDGVALTPAQFACSREHGWISVGTAPATALVVSYTYSSKLDMAVTNWDSTIGNYVYYNQLVVKGDANCDGRTDMEDVPLFVMLLVDRPAYDAIYPDCNADLFCDMNSDGVLNGKDVQGFVQRLISGT